MAYGRDRTVLPVTILNGATVSSEVQSNGLKLVGIQMPAGWTAGNITLQALTRQAAGLPAAPTFGAVVDGAGTPIVVCATPTLDTYYQLPTTLNLQGMGRIKVVAGAAQGAQRDFFLVFE